MQGGEQQGLEFQEGRESDVIRFHGPAQEPPVRLVGSWVCVGGGVVDGSLCKGNCGFTKVWGSPVQAEVGCVELRADLH